MTGSSYLKSSFGGGLPLDIGKVRICLRGSIVCLAVSYCCQLHLPPEMGEKVLQGSCHPGGDSFDKCDLGGIFFGYVKVPSLFLGKKCRRDGSSDFSQSSVQSELPYKERGSLYLYTALNGCDAHRYSKVEQGPLFGYVCRGKVDGNSSSQCNADAPQCSPDPLPCLPYSRVGKADYRYVEKPARYLNFDLDRDGLNSSSCHS